MKHAAWSILTLAGAALLLVHWGHVSRDGARAVAAPPLSLKGYLDEKLPETPKKARDVKADNSACYVCHGNYEGEELALVHATKDIGCAKCHGESYDHRNDEDNVTPPDVMFASDEIGKACKRCHKTHDAPAAKVITRWQERCPAKDDPRQIVCTDCHGKHRLDFRTVWWDKKTRKLVIRGEQRTKVNPDYTKKAEKKAE